MLSNQEVFDKAVGGVLRQGRLSTSGGTCMYRAQITHPKGCRTLACGIGHLIPDELYQRRMEMCGVVEVLNEEVRASKPSYAGVYSTLEAVGVNLESAETRQLLIAIQRDHDNAYGIADYRQAAARTARAYGLDAGVLEQVV